MRTSAEIRQQFIDFYVKKHGHTFIPSSSVVPHDDPTLLFANAGMNQFKDVFLGTGSRPVTRVANTQKCIRAGGKHNDLDDVGKDTYHHTFFEMLGNWSFGDYFKKEAIQWAWELLTEVWMLDKSRLHATVFEGSRPEGVPRDDEAFELWRTVTDIDPKNIHWGNKKDNFWEMGDTGPCGPCTEIHVDRTPNKNGGKLVNTGSSEVMEIWNLVFIQFNRNEDRSLTPLPARHVDTGMGFERVTAVLQGKASNYDTDVFTPIFAAIRELTKAEPYGSKLEDIKDIAYRVIADHIRTLTFALTDGARPGNMGREYVLKRILRRAERYGRQYLGTKEPFLCQLVPTVVTLMGDAFPELKKDPARVANLIREEELSFIKTLDRGIKMFKEAIEWEVAASAEGMGDAGGRTISGPVAFKLHDTYGLYIDIVEQMAEEEGVTVDHAGFEREMDEAKRKARGARKKQVISAVTGTLPKTDDSPKFNGLSCRGEILGWVEGNEVVRQGTLQATDEVALLLDRTNFYAEQGGQVGDLGQIRTSTGRFEVQDTRRLGECVLHVGRVVEGSLEPGQEAELQVHPRRDEIRRNHTATHLLNWALRSVLGEHVEQKGSLVDPEKTRFDFAHDTPLSHEQIQAVEKLVNDKICADLVVQGVTTPLAQAQQVAGVRAVFGEKYPDPVRVLLIGPETIDAASPDDSVEFCGGTHVTHTGEIGFFKIVSQEGIAKGVRRVTALTGPTAVAHVQKMLGVLEELSGRFNCKPEEVMARLDALQDENKKLHQQLKKGATTDLAGAIDRLFASALKVGEATIIVGELPAGPDEQIRTQVDRIKQKAGSAVVAVGWNDEGKVGLLVAVTDDLVKQGVHAGKLIGEIAKVVGGGGGGRPTMAQAGGKDPAKLAEALDLARQLVQQQLAK